MVQLDPYAAHCLDLLDTLGACQAKRMFGGWGIYREGLMFGLIADEQLYLKVDDHSRAQWQAAGARPFVYQAKGRSVALSYYSAPDAAMEAPHAMRLWAQWALEAALRGRSRQLANKRKPKVTQRQGGS